MDLKRNSRRGAAAVIALTFGVASLASAQEESTSAPFKGAISGNLERLDDAELDRRIEFIESRLDDGQFNSQVWQYGWTAGYGVGAAIGAVGAPLRKNTDDRVNDIVTGVKGAFGVTRMLLAPHPGRHGGEPIRAVEGDAREDRLERLAVAEGLLEENVDRAEDRWSWKRHLGNVVVNLAGGAVVWTLGEEGQAITSTLVGITVGTAHAFSMPWRAEDDLVDYRREFEGIEPSRVSWSVAPIATEDTAGVAFSLKF